MTDERPVRQYSNAQLRSYLDDSAVDALRAEIEAQLEYDDALQKRLAALDDMTAMMRAASGDLLAAAPTDRLEGRLRAAERELADRSPLSGGKSDARRRRAVDFMRTPALIALAASLVLMLAIGVVAGRYVYPSGHGRSQAPAWVTAAADHVRLYSADTLMAVRLNADEKTAAVNIASAHLALDLAPALVAAPRLYFQKSEVLQFEDRPLVELAYLHDTGTPVALYVLGEAEPHPEQEDFISGDIDGLNVTYWRHSSYEFLIVGDLDKDQLETIANNLAATLQ